MAKRAEVKVSLEVLRRLLHLDDTLSIDSVAQDFEGLQMREATIFISGDGLPDCFTHGEGNLIIPGRIKTTSSVECERVNFDEEGDDHIVERRIIKSEVIR